MVRCKMKVQKLAQVAQNTTPPSAIDEVTLSPVYGPGNESWSKWTPSGSVVLQITNPEAVGQFAIGKDYFVDFSPAE